MKFSNLLVVVALLACSACIREKDGTVNCRDFQFSGEAYWFPLPVNDSVVFINPATAARKKFVVAQKGIGHRLSYSLESECGCYDNSYMVMLDGEDKMTFENFSRYMDNNSPTRTEEITFVFNGVVSNFNRSSRLHLDAYVIDSTPVYDVYCYSCDTCESALSVAKCYRAKNIGLIAFEHGNGDQWVYDSLTLVSPPNIDSFDFGVYSCP